MCIAIYRPTGKPLSKNTLFNCWENNPDGAGFMWAEDGVLHIEKGFMKFKHLWKAIRSHLLDKDRTLVIHFRIATSGKVDYDNCHPHLINDGLAFVHNGIIYELNDDKTKCDTVRFAEILAQLPKGFMHNKSAMNLIHMAAPSSKFVFMNNLGQVVIVNEVMGVEVEDVWFSNTTFHARAYSRSYTYDRRYVTERDWDDYPEWSIAPHNSYANKELTASTQAILDMDIKELPAEIDIPISASMRGEGRFDVDIPVNQIDDQGMTNMDYEEMALAECQYWLRHHEDISPYAYNELCDILDCQGDGEEIRYMMQDWIDSYQPDYHNAVKRQLLALDAAEKKKKAIIATASASISTSGAKVIVGGDGLTPAERLKAIVDLSKPGAKDGRVLQG